MSCRKIDIDNLPYVKKCRLITDLNIDDRDLEEGNYYIHPDYSQTGTMPVWGSVTRPLGIMKVDSPEPNVIAQTFINTTPSYYQLQRVFVFVSQKWTDWKLISS